MKKTILAIAVLSLFNLAIVNGQAKEDVISSRALGENSNEKANMKKMFQFQSVKEDKTETVDITGISGAIFTVSNTADGSANSYKHTVRITLGLQAATSKSGSFQLVFYSAPANIPYAVTQEAGMTSIYYPEELYESIRQRLEQALNARKKVQVKIVQRTDGFREGSIVM